MRDVKIAPSILSADFARLGEQVQAAEAAGAEMIHIDVMDGRFVPNITMGPLVVKAVRKVTSLPLDVHLMIVEPDHMISAFADAGADHIAVHYEACVDLYRTLNIIKRHGVKAGIAINPHTRAADLYDVFPILDLLTVMTVSPGFGGQSLLRPMLPKIQRLRRMAIEDERPNLPIIADGGVNVETAAEIAAAGANVLVAGSAVFGGESVAENIKTLRQAIQ